MITSILSVTHFLMRNLALSLHNMQSNNQHIVNKLTALWALSECGLGGMIHAFKMPFSGFFLGGFAVLVIHLVALHSSKPFQQIIKSTLLVMLVKAVVSPHSPWPAYVAVGFQGLSGAVIFGLFQSNLLTNMVFGWLALTESATQKILLTTLIYGKSLWTALDVFFQSITKEFKLSGNVSFSLVVISLYVGTYMLWGLVLGVIMRFLPNQINKRKAMVIERYHALTAIDELPSQTRTTKQFKYVGMFFMVLFISGIFVVFKPDYAWFYLVRTTAVLIIFYAIIGPGFKWLIHAISKKQSNNAALNQLIADVNNMKLHAKAAYALSKTTTNKLKQLALFVLNLFVLAMFVERKQAQ